MKKIKIIEVSQFFDWHNMTWEELAGGKEKGVLPSTDGSVYLWTESPRIQEVDRNSHPSIGDVWLMNVNGKPEIFKANYDSSD
jgi:hypothetical protein